MFVASCGAGRFAALSIHSGSVRWSYSIHEDDPLRSFHGAALVTDELVVIAADNTFRHAGIGFVYAFERGTGRVRWKHRSEAGIPSDVAFDGERVFVSSLADELLCLGVSNGRLLWRYATGEVNEALRATTSPVTVGGRVLFASLDGTVAALAARDGDALWRRRLPGRVSAGPALYSDGCYVGTSDGVLYKLALATGEVVREIQLPARPSGVPAVDERHVYLRLGEKMLAAIRVDLSGVAWQHECSGRWWARRPLLAEDVVVVGDSSGTLAGLFTGDGAMMWRAEFPNEDIRSVSAAAGVFYVGTLDGTVYAWQPTVSSATSRQAERSGDRVGGPGNAARGSE